MLKPMPIGISDFKELIERKYYFVDKSELIKGILDDGAKVILIPRPRRFGKTLNLSMAHYFLNCATIENNAHLFTDLAIQKHADCMSQQGTFPSIFLTFKEVKAANYAQYLRMMQEVLGQLYGQYRYLLEGSALSEEDKVFFEKILKLQGDEVSMGNALKMLTKFLYLAYGKRVMIFLDEYDAPIHVAYLKDYYEQIIDFMRVFMGGAFKDNTCLEKGVITGILRISQASIFSDLNNVETYSLLRRDYSEYFGFTQDEVDTLLTEADLLAHSTEIKNWYNGYQVEELKLYNPWSILNCVKQKGTLQPYWLNTSDNALIKELLGRANSAMKEVLESLLQGESVVQPIKEHIALSDLAHNEEAIWGLLLFSGYLTVTSSEMSGYGLNCRLCIPNQEVGVVYADMIRQWFRASLGLKSYDKLLKSLVSGDWETFSYVLRDYVQTSGSYFDFNAHTPEAVYHAFILGLVVGLRDDYIIQSNPEAGYGRCDVAIIPKDSDSNRSAMILEFKRTDNAEALEETAQAALRQISTHHYTALLAQHKVKNITALGVAFAGKRVQVAVQDYNR